MGNFRDNTPDRSGETPQESGVDPRSILEAAQRRQGQRLDLGEDRTYSLLSTLLLTGIGGYAALRFFPKSRIAGFAREIKAFFQNPTRFGVSDKVREKLEAAVARTSQIVTEMPWANVHVDRFGEVLGSARSAVDPEINRALSILTDVARHNPQNFTNVLQIRSPKASHLLRPIPQDTSGLHTLRLRDQFNAKGGWRTDLWGPMPEPYGNIQKTLQNLTKIRTPSTQKLAWDVIGDIEVDPGLLIKRTGTGHQLFDIRKTQPSYWIRNLGQKAAAARGQPLADQIRSGGLLARLGNWATQLLVPTELTHTGVPLAVVGSGRHQHLFVSGRLHPLVQKISKVTGEVRYTGLGHAQEGEFVLGRADTAMGSAARMRTRDYAGATARYLKEQAIDPESFKGWMVRAGGKLGIGPQFALPKEAKAAAGAAVENIEGLAFSGQGRTIGQMLTSLRETAEGKASELAGTYYARPAGSAGVKQGLSDWANYLVNRVGYLAEEASGRVAGWFGKDFKIGIRPGKTPLGSLARWTGLGMAAYGGWQALQYVDYHSRNLIGTGPISAPLQLYAGLRTVGQYALAATGIQQTSRDLENLFPGLIDSPASRIARAYLAYRLFRGKGPLGILGERFAETGAKLAAKTNLEAWGQRLWKPLQSQVNRLAQSARFPEFVRSAATATAQWMGRHEGIGRRAGAAAALALAGMQLTDITESPAHLRGVFAGDINIQVREGRGWMAGTAPFGGGRVLYERPHFIPTFLSRAGDIGRYGSETERWRQSFLPTPESWGGLRPLLDPYRNERLNYATRPYPLTGPMFKEVPFIGPLLSATLGELIKPTQRWHGEYWRRGQLQEPYPTEGYPGAAEALGYGATGLRPGAASPIAPSNVIGRQIDIIRDFLGMPGFLVGAIKKALTGEEDFASQSRQIATAGEITSNERAYYEQELGGVLGFSELFRRFLPHRRRATELVNPILNQSMQDWIPGSRSAFAGDVSNRVDFHRGDPFANIPYGEARLPGPAYEALHRLHSGVPGVYDAYDRWKILRDIAPTSEAFRHYDTIVRSWARVGALAKTSEGKPLEQIYRGMNLRGVVRQVLDGDTIVVDVHGKLTNVRLAGGDAPEIAHSTFEASLPDTVAGDLAKRRLESHLLNRSVSVAIESYSRPNPKLPGRYVGRVVSQGFGARDVSGELEQAHPAYNLTEQQIAEINSNRYHLEQRFQPYPFVERIFDNPFAAVPRNMRTLPERSLSAINQAIKDEGEFSLPEKLLGRAWESASHVVLPGPLNWPFNKFFAQRDPLEVYKMQVQGGLSFGDWNNPIEGFLRPWMNQSIGTVVPGYVPERVQQQRFVESGLDVIHYEKMQRLAQQAQTMGQPGMARYYQDKVKRTATHAIMEGQLRFAQGALSRTDRGFWVPFQRETDPRRRERILNLASPDMGAMLRQAWKYDTREDQAERGALLEDLRNRPKPDWSGWHPSVPLNAMKVRVAKREAWDIHDMGLTHRDEYLAEDLFSNYDPVDSPAFSQGSEIRMSGYQQSNRLKLQGIQISTIDAPGPPEIRLDIRRSRRRFYQLQDRMERPSLTGMRF